jgi:hypothetical protein
LLVRHIWVGAWLGSVLIWFFSSFITVKVRVHSLENFG